MAVFRIPVETLPPPNKDGNHLVRVRVVSDNLNRISSWTTLYTVESKGQIWPQETQAQIYKASASVINLLWETPSVYNIRNVTRKNLIFNPSFETNASFWSRIISIGASSISRTTSDAKFGLGSLEITKGTGKGNASTTTSVSSVQPGKEYVASAYVKVPTGEQTSSLLCQIRFLNPSGSVVGPAFIGSPQTVQDSDDWTRISVIGTCPQNASRAQIIILEELGGTAGQKFLIDGVLFEEGNSLADYFDGSTAPSAGVVSNQWTGTENASPSTQIEDAQITGDPIVHNHGTEWKVHDSDIYVQWDADEFIYYGRNKDNDVSIEIKPGASTVRVWGQVANYFPTRGQKFKIFDTGTIAIASL
jgi:hypothetical protein